MKHIEGISSKSPRKCKTGRRPASS